MLDLATLKITRKENRFPWIISWESSRTLNVATSSSRNALTTPLSNLAWGGKRSGGRTIQRPRERNTVLQYIDTTGKNGPCPSRNKGKRPSLALHFFRDFLFLRRKHGSFDPLVLVVCPRKPCSGMKEGRAERKAFVVLSFLSSSAGTCGTDYLEREGWEGHYVIVSFSLPPPPSNWRGRGRKEIGKW